MASDAADFIHDLGLFEFKIRFSKTVEGRIGYVSEFKNTGVPDEMVLANLRAHIRLLEERFDRYYRSSRSA